MWINAIFLNLDEILDFILDAFRCLKLLLGAAWNGDFVKFEFPTMSWCMVHVIQLSASQCTFSSYLRQFLRDKWTIKPTYGWPCKHKERSGLWDAKRQPEKPKCLVKMTDDIIIVQSGLRQKWKLSRDSLFVQAAHTPLIVNGAMYLF